MDLSFIETIIMDWNQMTNLQITNYNLQIGFPTEKEIVTLIKTLNLHQMVALLLPSKAGGRWSL